MPSDWIDAAANAARGTRRISAELVRRIIREHAKASGWQPIDTAPKDGGTLLLFRKYVCTGY